MTGDNTWFPADQEKYVELMNTLNDRELTETEKESFFDLFRRKFIKVLRDPERKKMASQIEKSVTLVDDMVADGADLTSSEKAEMTVLLFNAGDKMVQRFSLIKKAGRCQSARL